MSTVYQLSDRNKKLNVFFLNTILASGTYGASLAKHKLAINDSTGNPAFPSGSINFQELELPIGYVLNLAETLGVVKPTEPTLAAGGEYGFTITQYNPYTGATVSHPIYASVPVISGVTTAGTIATAWANQIAMFQDLNVSTSVTGAVLTITALAGYPILTIGGQFGGVTLTSGTTGVAGIGNTYDMEANNGITGQPFSNFAGYNPANSYDMCVFNHNTYDGEEGQTILFVNTGDASYSSWFTQVVTDYLKMAAGYAEAALAVD